VSDDGRIAGIQKSGLGALSVEEVMKATEIALNVSKDLLAMVEKSLTKPT
jgi:exosome complex RNA-binding protein Rrp42 (RNase PH superfamily)